MNKQHTIFSVLLSIAFLILVQQFSYPRPVFRFLAPAFVLHLILLTWYNHWYLNKIGKYNVWTLIRPVLFFGSAFALYNVIPVEFLKGSFLVLIVFLGVVVEMFLGNFAENLLLNETLIIAFSLCMAIAAYALQYFPSFHLVYLVFLFLGLSLTVRSFYEFTPETSGKKLVSSLALALFCTQIFWAFSFLPLHFSAIGLMLFNIFYFCLILNYYFIFNNLNERKFQFHVVLLTLTTVFIFLLTPWRVLQ